MITVATIAALITFCGVALSSNRVAFSGLALFAICLCARFLP